MGPKKVVARQSIKFHENETAILAVDVGQESELFESVSAAFRQGGLLGLRNLRRRLATIRLGGPSGQTTVFRWPPRNMQRRKSKMFDYGNASKRIAPEMAAVVINFVLSIQRKQKRN